MSDAFRLFQHYKQNLNMVYADPRVNLRPTRDDVVICPLCYDTWFTVEAIENDLLTLEHVPPESLGGKGRVLTCKTCNNTQGSALDAPLASFIQDIDALRGKGEGYVDGTWKTEDGGKVRIEFRTNETGWAVNAVPKGSHPQHLKFLNDQFEQNSIEEFNISLKITDPKRANLGLLRTAYLLAFYYMGYGFLTNPHLRQVRHQLQHPEEGIFPHNAVQWFLEQEVPDNLLGVSIIYEPAAWKSYLIVFDVQRKCSIPYRVGVMLPGPNPRDYEFFEYMKTAETKMSGTQLHHYEISFEDKLKYPFLGRAIWNNG
jgi:hypothetical protein